MDKEFCVYIMTNKYNTVLYIGVTSDLRRRVWQHKCGKATLGKLVHQKTATCVALTAVGSEDMSDLENLGKAFKAKFNENSDLRKHWGGGVMGIKNQHKMAKRQKLLDIELAKKANM